MSRVVKCYFWKKCGNLDGLVTKELCQTQESTIAVGVQEAADVGSSRDEDTHLLAVGGEDELEVDVALFFEGLKHCCIEAGNFIGLDAKGSVCWSCCDVVHNCLLHF